MSWIIYRLVYKSQLLYSGLLCRHVHCMPLFFKTNLSVDISQRIFLQHKIYSVRVCIKKPSCDLVVCCILRSWQTRTHCCGHIVADTNVSSFARARNICCGHKFCVRDTKNVSVLFRNILCPQHMFPSLRSPRNITGNNVSATKCPRLPGSLIVQFCLTTRKVCLFNQSYADT